MTARRGGEKAAAFVVHGIAHVRAALAAARETGCAIRLVSAPSAAGYAGGAWFAALERSGRRAFPDVDATFILDCGDAPGWALAAIRAGVRHIRLSGNRRARDSVAAIAAASGARIVTGRLNTLDLQGESDPYQVCLRRLRPRARAKLH